MKYINFSNTGNIPLKYLAKSLGYMADVDLVVFIRGWRGARGCRIEHKVCVAYSIPYEEK